MHNRECTWYYYCTAHRDQNNGITVCDMSDDNRAVPNPVETFQQAFEHYREPIVAA